MQTDLFAFDIARDSETLLYPPEYGTEDVLFERNPRAKYYRLTLRRDGQAVVTIPRRGTERVARAFAVEQSEWLEQMRQRHRSTPRQAAVWSLGTPVLWRGEMTEIRAASWRPFPQVCLGADVFRVSDFDSNLRPTLEAHFQRLARIELTARTWELSARTRMPVRRVVVRNQRTRWGSCSVGKEISLNWRIIQTPDWVRDYVIHHELTHLKIMDHSPRFWRRLAEVFPRVEKAEAWLKHDGSLLGL